MNRIVPLLSLAAAFSMTLMTTAHAQSASVNSTATIVTPISAAATAPLAFGTISKGATATVAASTSSAGAVNFSGDESDNITVTIPSTVVIATSSGAGANMTVTLDRAGVRYTPLGNIPPNGASVVDASSGTVTVGLSMDNQGNATNNDGLGQAYLWIGGSVTPSAAQQRGSYSGSFTVSAAYSN
jgi:hypothetical protein